MKRKTGNTNRKFRKNDIIQSQLPSPQSPHSGDLYNIVDVDKTGYKIQSYSKKDRTVLIDFKYIENGVYLEGIYTPNFILFSQEEKDVKNIQKGDKISSRNRSKKSN